MISTFKHNDKVHSFLVQVHKRSEGTIDNATYNFELKDGSSADNKQEVHMNAMNFYNSIYNINPNTKKIRIAEKDTTLADNDQEQIKNFDIELEEGNIDHYEMKDELLSLLNATSGNISPNAITYTLDWSERTKKFTIGTTTQYMEISLRFEEEKHNPCRLLGFDPVNTEFATSLTAPKCTQMKGITELNVGFLSYAKGYIGGDNKKTDYMVSVPLNVEFGVYITWRPDKDTLPSIHKYFFRPDNKIVLKVDWGNGLGQVDALLQTDYTIALDIIDEIGDKKNNVR